MLFVFNSCNTSNSKKKVSTVQTVIDYSKIDLFPALPECKNIPQNQLKNCFFKNISKRIKSNLNLNQINFNDSNKDSIIVNFVIDTIGKTRIISIKHSLDSVKKDSLDFYIKKSFNKLPIMQPAIKMGIPVNAQFRIPIILKPINKS